MRLRRTRKERLDYSGKHVILVQLIFNAGEKWLKIPFSGIVNLTHAAQKPK